jgi:hypothetical protein
MVSPDRRKSALIWGAVGFVRATLVDGPGGKKRSIFLFNPCQDGLTVIKKTLTQYSCCWQVMRLSLRKAVFASLNKN